MTPSGETGVAIGPGLDDGTGQGRFLIFDISKARAQLGYEPEFDLRTGIEDYLATLDRQAGS